MYTDLKRVHKRFQIQLNKIYIGHSQLKKKKPQLNKINYNPNGSIEITNTFIAIRLKNIHNEVEKEVQSYPNLNSIFETENERDQHQIKLNKVNARILENLLNVLYRNNEEQVDIEINKNKITLKSYDKDSPFIQVSTKLENTTTDIINFRMSTIYLHDALMFFRQMKIENITLKKSSNALQPLLIQSKNLDYIILPIRP